jgi:Arc/MetJ family transcription regulator
MGINVLVDEKLVEEAKLATGLSDNQAAIDQIIRRVLSGRRKHQALLELVGQIQFYDGYDPRALRS